MHHDAQPGQALAEALIVLLVLGSLWLAVAWLGRLQDIGLQLAHASRRLAFAHAHQGLAERDPAVGAAAYFGAAGQRWHTRQGQALLASGVRLVLDSLPHTPAVQPGDPHPQAGALRAQLRLGDAAVWRARAIADTRGQETPRGTLHGFDRRRLTLQRHTAILRGSGAAAGDAQVQATLGGSAQAWASQAGASQAAGRRAQQRLQAMDAAWNRPQVSWNWLDPWAGWIPSHHLQPGRQP